MCNQKIKMLFMYWEVACFLTIKWDFSVSIWLILETMWTLFKAFDGFNA